MGELESTKSVSDLFAPVSGTVARAQRGIWTPTRSCATATRTARAGSSRSRPSDASAAEGLMSAADYEATVTSN